MDITKADLLNAKCTDFHEWREWNEWLVHQINDLGFIQLSSDINILYFLTLLIISIILAPLISKFLKTMKETFGKKEYIIEEINSCTRHYLEKCLESDEFRKLLIKISATVLISFSLIGAFLGSAMFGFLFGALILSINLYDYLHKLHES